MYELVNPEGRQKILIAEDNIQEKIVITDRERGNRDFFLEVVVEGKNSGVEIVGRAESRESDAKKWRVSLELVGSAQNGSLDIRGVSDDKGKLEFDGGGVIRETSSDGDIRVNEKIILFSPQAKAKNVPVLTVQTEDVRSASHAASIAPFDPQLIFFLESRGVSSDHAKQLLRSAFLGIAACDDEVL